MAPTTRNRVPVKDRLGVLAVLSFADEDEPVAVLYSANQDSGEVNRILFIGPAEGPNERNTLGHGPTSSTDEFTVQCSLVIFGEPSDDGTAEHDAEAEVERLLIAFEDTLRVAKNLRHPDAPEDPPSTAENPPPYDGIQTPTLGDVDGPRHSLVDETGVFQAWVDFSIYCKTIIRGGS